MGWTRIQGRHFLGHCTRGCYLSRGVDRTVLGGVVVAGSFSAFILPFLLPVSDAPVLSVAYMAGANNRFATVCVAAIAMLVLGLVALRIVLRDQSVTPALLRGASPDERLPGTWLSVGGLFVLLFTGLLGWVVLRSGKPYGEPIYFLERIRDVAQFHSRIYRDIEFPYGPLLLYPPVWLWRVVGGAGVSLAACYFTFLAAANAVGIAMSFYVLNALPLSKAWRRLWFVLFVMEQVHPLAGLNYTLGKFMLPFAVLVWGTGYGARRTERGGMRPLGSVVRLALGTFLVLLVSPELAIGLAAGICVWGLLRALRGERWYLAALLAPVAASKAFYAIFGSGFVQRLHHASAGALNLILEPVPDLLVLLFAVLWLVPAEMGLEFRLWWQGRAGAAADHASGMEPAVMAGMFLLSLGLLPGVMGRADPLHVFFNGFGFLLLSAVAVQRMGCTRQRIWGVLLVLVCVQVQATNYKVYASAIADIVRSARHPEEVAAERRQDSVEVARLRRLVNGEVVALPMLSISPGFEAAMRAQGLYRPDFYPGLGEIWDLEGEDRKIATLDEYKWALMPAEWSTQPWPELLPNHDRVKLMFRFGYKYKFRHAPYLPGGVLFKHVQSQWMPVARFGNLVLYRNPIVP